MGKHAEEKNADIIICGYRRIETNGNIKQEVLLKQTEWSKYKIVAPWSKLYKTEFIKQNNILFLPITLGEDIYFLMNAYSYAPKIEILEGVGYNWTYNVHSLSNTAFYKLNNQTSILQLFNALENLKNSDVLKRDKMYEYFLIKTAIWNILYTLRSNSFRNVLENKKGIWDWFECHFCNYMRNPYLRIGKPNGEKLNIKLVIWGYMKIKKIGLEYMLLRFLCKIK